MTHPRRLVLAMILLVVGTSCVVSAVTWYLVTQSPSDGAVTTIAAAAGAGGAIGILYAVAIAAGLAKFTHDPPPGDAASANAADVAGASRGSRRAFQATPRAATRKTPPKAAVASRAS